MLVNLNYSVHRYVFDGKGKTISEGASRILGIISIDSLRSPVIILAYRSLLL